jgi:hypothetical protein
MAQGKKFVPVKAYTRTIDGKKIEVRASERRTPAPRHSSKCGGSLRDALKTPFQSAAVALGWHVILDGNVWCAVGPIFEDLLFSPSGWGSTPEEARESLNKRHERAESAQVPQLPAFRVWA